MKAITGTHAGEAPGDILRLEAFQGETGPDLSRSGLKNTGSMVGQEKERFWENLFIVGRA